MADLNRIKVVLVEKDCLKWIVKDLLNSTEKRQ